MIKSQVYRFLFWDAVYVDGLPNVSAAWTDFSFKGLLNLEMQS